MTRMMQKLPLPVAGVMLALATLGNMLGVYGNVYRNLAGALAAGILLLLIGKVLINRACLREGFANPVVAGVIPTFSMAIMVLSTYLRPYSFSVAYGTWLTGLVLHAGLILYFSRLYLLNFSLKKVFPSYFIVYVGIVVGSVTAPLYNQAALGQGLFWFGFAANLLLLPVVLYRVLRVREIPEAALPTIAIFAAPTSLCLVGYLNVFPERSPLMLGFLVTLALVMTAFAFVNMPKLLRLQFYPSYSAFTFPFVISAVAVKGASGAFISLGMELPLLGITALFLEVWAVAMVSYVVLRYTGFLLPQAASNDARRTTA